MNNGTDIYDIDIWKLKVQTRKETSYQNAYDHGRIRAILRSMD